MIRIGQGFDVHQLVAGRPLVLGGVQIEYEKGLAGHSDADVLIHSLCDALLGAMGKGDIGQHFPDTDGDFKGIDSRLLLGRVMDMMQADSWQLINADLTLIAQAPKLSPYIPQMRENLSADLLVEAAQVNIKATTTETLGFCGRGEGMAALAIALIEKEPANNSE